MTKMPPELKLHRNRIVRKMDDLTIADGMEIGFDACFFEMSKTHVPIADVQILLDALRYYADIYNYDEEQRCVHWKSKITFIADCGTQASIALTAYYDSREALEKINV